MISDCGHGFGHIGQWAKVIGDSPERPTDGLSELSPMSQLGIGLADETSETKRTVPFVPDETSETKRTVPFVSLEP